MVQSEERLTDALQEHLKAMGMKTAREVSIESKRIDIVAYDGSELMAVEVKVSNWKRAFQQALTYRFGADRVYIAMAEEYIHRVDRKLLESYGIGLISMGKSVKVMLDAKRQEHTDMELREKIMKEVEE